MASTGPGSRSPIYAGAARRVVPLVLGLGLALAVGGGIPAAGQTWGLLEPGGNLPGARLAAAAVMDPAARQMIVFGGTVDGYEGLTDVWRLTLGTNPSWVQVNPSGTAPTYGGGTAVYDTTNSRMIVFGGFFGQGPGSSTTVTNQVWVLNNANGVNGTPAWIPLSPGGAPPAARNAHAAVYDQANNRMIVFGGFTGTAHLNDVWVLTNANGLNGTPGWIQLSPAGTPPTARSLHNAVYDQANNRLMVFGGSSQTSLLNDAWVLTNANGLGGTPAWTQLAPAGFAPSPREWANTVFDPSTNEMVLFGGESATAVLSDVWSLSNANGLGGTPFWTERFPDGFPGARFGATGVFSPGNDELIVFGGNNGSIDGDDTWILDDANGAPAPDLVITGLTGPNIITGSVIAATVTVANLGTATSAPFDVEYYWSKTPFITTGAIDSGWGCYGLTLAAGTNITCSGNIGVPVGLTAGIWYLGAIADPTMSIPELNKTNNTGVSESGATLVPAPSVACTAAAMTFSYAPGGAPPPSQTCTVTTIPSGYGVAVTVSGGNWLSAALNPASSPATLTVSANPAGLAAGVYSGTVTVQTIGGASFRIAVSLAIAQPLLTIFKNHGGNFSVGQQGATYTVTVANATGSATTSGTVTVTENVPPGMTLVSMKGTGWNCPGGVTCTRDDGLAGGVGYPAITVTVNVAGNATSPLLNSVSVSGGGSATASAFDSTIITGGATASQAYLIGTVAGGGLPATPAQAVNVGLGLTSSVRVDKSGNIYFTSDNCVFKIDSLGTLTIVAGSSTAGGFAGDGGPATGARLNAARGIALDSAGNLYIADEENNRVRKVAAGTGLISTIAGTGSFGYSGDGGQATSAQLNLPAGVTVDANGNLFIAELGNNRIRKVVLGSGIITTVAGDGVHGYGGDGGPATSAQLGGPVDVAVDGSGNLFIADYANNRVRKVTAGGTITTVAGDGTAAFSGDGGLAVNAELYGPSSVVADGAGDLLIADSNNFRIRYVSAAGFISTAAGNGTGGLSGDGGPATSAELDYPDGITLDNSGNLIIADTFNYRIRRVSVSSLTITTIAGSNTAYSGDGKPAATAQLSPLPLGVAVDGAGNFYIVDADNSRIRKVSAATGIISTVAGNGTAGFSGDNNQATSAQINQPNGVAVDSAGNLYIADTLNYRVRKVTAATGIISTVAGTGTAGYSGDGGPALSAKFDQIFGLTVDGAGNIYIADALNFRIRKVTVATGTITTVAGNGTLGSAGDGGPATSAQISQAGSMAVDGAGNLFIADTFNSRVRKVAAGSGFITTVAGNGTLGFAGDGGAATSAELGDPLRVALNSAGDIYIADVINTNVRKVTAATGIITTLSGSGTNALSLPSGLAVGGAGRVFIAESTLDSGGLVILVNDSGMPISQLTSGNAVSSDHLTFNLLIQPSAGGHTAGAAEALLPANGRFAPGNAAASDPRLRGEARSGVTVKRPAGTPLAPLTTAGGSGGTVSVGGTVQFTQTLARDPSSPAVSNVSVGSTLPPSWTITGCTADSGGTCSATGTDTISVSFPALSGQTAPTITITADQAGNDTSVEVESSASSSSASLATSLTSQTLLPSPGAAVALSFQGPTSTVAGQTLTYTVALNNSGQTKVAGDPMAVTISPDPSLTGVSVADASWACVPAGASLVCTTTSAVQGGSGIGFTVTGTVSGGGGGILKTTATLTLGGQTSAAQAVNTSVGVAGPAAPVLVSPPNGTSGLYAPVPLTWSAASGATSYSVYFGTSNPPPQVLSSTTLLSFTAPSPALSTTYYWQIGAGNPSGTTRSPVYSFTTGAAGGCQFTITGGSANLPSAGTATATPTYPGGVQPEVPITVSVAPQAGNCSGTYTAASSAPWLSATTSGAHFTYTALANAHSKPQSATLVISNSNGGSQTFTVTEAGDSETLLMRQVRALYQSMLGRDPDAGGFAFWTGSGTAGLGQMGDSFLTSPEAFNTDFAVMAAYQAATGAVPTYAAFTAAAGRVRVNSQSIAQLFTSLLGNGYSAATLYQNLLKRAPTAGEVASAGNTPASLAAWFETLIGFPGSTAPVGAANNEFESTGTLHGGPDHSNGLYIAMLYYTILDRDLDGSGYDFWVGVANSGGPGIEFQGQAAYATRIQILGPGTPNQGYIGSPEFQGLYQ